MTTKYVSKTGLGKYHVALIARVQELLPTKSSLGLSNVENKSSATIRSELTQADVLGATTGVTLADLEGWSVS